MTTRKTMGKIASIVFALMLACGSVAAQPARAILDKVAATLSNKGGVTANFTIKSKQYGNASGSIAVKGAKFRTTLPQATVWFDGKTQWTYVKNNDEVNINTPTEGELQAINPYNFINIYKSGYSFSMTTAGNSHRIHLTATDKSRQIQEMYITVNKSTCVPSNIRMRQGANWSDISISQFKKANLGDAAFRFNQKDYPTAEIIDLR